MLVSTLTGLPVEMPRGSFALAIGCFDGLHVGHAALLRRLLSMAGDAIPAAWTFDVPEDAAVCPVKGKPLLVSGREKLRLFAACGIRYAFLYEFPKLAALPPEEFVSRILLDECRCGFAVCGYDFTFGARASGNAALLASLLSAGGAKTEIVPPVLLDGAAVSSSTIRAALAAGEVETVARMLGRPYTVSSTVVPGKQLGRTLGFPTVNQRFFSGAALPRFGVYAGKTEVDGVCYPSVTNVGVRPTVEEDGAPNAETFILDYSGDLYGKSVTVSLLHFLRPEKRFDSPAMLADAVACDVAAARRFADSEGGKQL